MALPTDRPPPPPPGHQRVRVAALRDLADGHLSYVLVEGLPIALARIGDQVYAFGDACRHEGGPLSSGVLIGHTVACPWHGWTYDVRTGKSLVPPVGLRIPTYPVTLHADAVYVDIDWGSDDTRP